MNTGKFCHANLATLISIGSPNLRDTKFAGIHLTPQPLLYFVLKIGVVFENMSDEQRLKKMLDEQI